LIIFIFDEYLDDLDLEFKNIQFVPFENLNTNVLNDLQEDTSLFSQINMKENVILSFYDNIYEDENNQNYSVNNHNIENTIIKPLSKLYNIYTSLTLFNNNQINELANFYKPFNMTLSTDISLKNNSSNKILFNSFFIQNMNDIYNIVEKSNIKIKLVIYIPLNSIFNVNISKFNYYINKINFLSYHIPYIDNTVSNSYQFLSIPYKYLNYIMKKLIQHIENPNMLYLIYSYIKNNDQYAINNNNDQLIINNNQLINNNNNDEYNINQNIHFMYNENFTNDMRTPLLNYLTDLKDINNNKGYLFNNKYYNYIIYRNSDSKIFVNDNNEYYFYKNKTSKSIPYMWIGTYVNYIKETILELIDIKIEFYIKLLKKIHVRNNNQFGLKTHEPIRYYFNWFDECILHNYKKIELNIKIYSKSQYIIINFDNYLDEVEFYIKDFKIII
jgi:hypothetical protein